MTNGAKRKDTRIKKMRGKMGFEDECDLDDIECQKRGQALQKIRKLAEEQKRFHSFGTHSYPEIDKILKEAGF